MKRTLLLTLSALLLFSCQSQEEMDRLLASQGYAYQVQLNFVK